MLRSAEHEPIEGATVLVKGSNRGVPTDKEGRFKIVLKAGESVLVFHHIGYMTQEMEVAPQPGFIVDLGKISMATWIICYGPGDYLSLGYARNLSFEQDHFQLALQQDWLPGLNIRLGSYIRYRHSTNFDGSQMNSWELGRLYNFTLARIEMGQSLHLKHRRTRRSALNEQLRQWGIQNHMSRGEWTVSAGYVNSEYVFAETNNRFHGLSLGLSYPRLKNYRLSVETRLWGNQTELIWSASQWLFNSKAQVFFSGEHLNDYHEVNLGLNLYIYH